MSEKGKCNFVYQKGKKKGQVCDKSCVIVGGEECRCACHKEAYLLRKIQLVNEQHSYLTKDHRICNLEKENAELRKKIDQVIAQNTSMINELNKTKKHILFILEDRSKVEKETQQLHEEIKKLKMAQQEYEQKLATLTAKFQNTIVMLNQGYKKGFEDVLNKLHIMDNQCKELAACSIKRTTKDKFLAQIESNTKSIEEIKKYIATLKFEEP